MPTKPQRLAGTATRDGMMSRGGANALKVAEWLASVNLSQTETREWPLKTLPRLKGKSTQVVVTEYDLPRTMIQPHDVIVDRDGHRLVLGFRSRCSSASWIRRPARSPSIRFPV